MFQNADIKLQKYVVAYYIISSLLQFYKLLNKVSDKSLTFFKH